MAAGMGTRYGGLKQIDPVGPGGETILEYSIYDALRAGFGKVVFVIRRDIEQPFKAHSRRICLPGTGRVAAGLLGSVLPVHALGHHARRSHGRRHHR
jgi:CTP:molybdopterin cytidylyltransferase MocA